MFWTNFWSWIWFKCTTLEQIRLNLSFRNIVLCSQIFVRKVESLQLNALPHIGYFNMNTNETVLFQNFFEEKNSYYRYKTEVCQWKSQVIDLSSQNCPNSKFLNIFFYGAHTQASKEQKWCSYLAQIKKQISQIISYGGKKTLTKT